VELKQLRCFLAVAEELNFGRAAHRLNMLPTALGRQVRLLEEELGAPLFERTTRQVAATPAGLVLLPEARGILDRAAAAGRMVQAMAPMAESALRIGAIDSAAAGLLPELLYRFRRTQPEVVTRLVEARSVQILPLLLAGKLELGFIRPPPPQDGLRFEWLLQEKPVVALPSRHPLARHRRLRLADLSGLPLVLPPRATRPHSHGVVTRLFALLGEAPLVAQEAEEKQTMIGLVAAGIGLALLPEWAARMRVPGAVYRPLDLPEGTGLPEWSLGAAWMENRPNPARDRFLAMLRQGWGLGAQRSGSSQETSATLTSMTSTVKGTPTRTKSPKR
jgi:DNA-binding transcriptional LysR family regulator